MVFVSVWAPCVTGKRLSLDRRLAAGTRCQSLRRSKRRRAEENSTRPTVREDCFEGEFLEESSC